MYPSFVLCDYNFHGMFSDPGAPVNVTGVGVSPTSLTIGWDPPVPPLSRIETYTVRRTGYYGYNHDLTVSAAEACPSDRLSGPRCHAKVTNLREDTQYSLTVSREQLDGSKFGEIEHVPPMSAGSPAI